MSFYIKQIQNVSYLFLLLLILACGISKNDASNEQNIEVREIPKIAFLTYEIAKSESGKTTIKLLEIIKTDGKLKPQDDENNVVVGDYQLLQLDSQGNSLSSKSIKNPLQENIEFVDDNGTFGKKEVTFNSKEVYVRIQLNAQTKAIIMQEVGSEPTNFLKSKI